MGIKECLVAIFAKLFLNTNLPCNEYLKDSIKTNMRTDCEIIERNDGHIVISFPFYDMPIEKYHEFLPCEFRQIS